LGEHDADFHTCVFVQCGGNSLRRLALEMRGRGGKVRLGVSLGGGVTGDIKL
jgi:hypothetical protein